MVSADRGLINGTHFGALKALRAFSILSSADLPSRCHCTCAISLCFNLFDLCGYAVLNTLPVVSIAHMVRASLFATATATTIGLRRSSKASIQGPLTRERAFGYRTTVRAPKTNRWRRYRSPCLVIPPSLCLPPEEFCRGVRPSQAANSRPDRKADGSGIVAAKAVAVIGPIPGMVASKRQIALVLWISASRTSILSICRLSASS